MRLILVVLLAGLCGLAVAAVPPQTTQQRVADQALLQKQKDILRLFRFVNQPTYYKDFVDIANNFNFEQYYSYFTKPEVARYFYRLFSHDPLPRGEIFSVFYEEHLKQAVALFKVFYYAKDYDTFYKTAVWARNYVNEGVFLYAFSVAIAHRPDCYGIILPPIYETYPYYFYNSEVIQKAYQYKQQYHGQVQDTKNSSFTIPANYSGYYLNLHPEQYLSYYLEDVGINSFYYYYNIYFPFWMDGSEFNLKNERRGELFYFVYQQLMARYYLERLSHGYGEIELFNWDLPVTTGYYSGLRYPNGFEFPTRPHHAKLHEYFYNYGQKWTFKGKYGYSYTFVQDYERRIRDVIDKGYVYTHDGTKIDLYSEDGLNIIGNIIESNPDSPNSRYYGALQVFARHLLGYSYQPLDKYQVAPSALEHFETSLRDPAFYQFYKRIVLFFYKYKSYLKPYTDSELAYPGVRVDEVEFDRLVTYFDHFYSDITNAVYVTADEFERDELQMRVRQRRLNHKPFTYRIRVQADREAQASVRVFIGPKYDEYGRDIDLEENRVNFVQFDHFTYDLKAGENVIARNSHQSRFYLPDRTSYRELYRKVMGDNGEFYMDGKQNYFGFPLRYLLPRGTYDGFEYQFYVIVSPYVPYKGQKNVDRNMYYYPQVGTGGQYLDGYPLGYPFDRHIDCEDFFQRLPNAYFYTTKIYHRDEENINSPHHIN